MMNNTQMMIIGPSVPVVVRPSMVVGPAEPIVIRPVQRETIHVSPSQPVLIEPSPVVTVEAPQRAVWDDRGWALRRDGNRIVYEGQYRVPNTKTGQRAEFDGRIVDASGIIAYIADPPAELRRHPKAACFVPSTGHWFQVKWYRAAKNADDALLYVEKILAESLSGSY